MTESNKKKSNYIPSQINLNDIIQSIKSSVDFISDITNIISNINNINRFTAASNNINELNQQLVGENGSITKLIEIIKQLDDLIKDNKLVNFVGPVQRKIIDGIFDNMMYVIDKMREIAYGPSWWEIWEYSPSEKDINKTQNLFNMIRTIIDSINELKLNLITELKIIFLGSILEQINEIISDLAFLSWKTLLTNKTALIDSFSVFLDLIPVLEQVNKISLIEITLAKIKINLLNEFIQKIDESVWDIFKLGLKSLKLILIAPAMIQLKFTLRCLYDILLYLKEMNLFLARRRLKLLAKIIISFNHTIIALRKINIKNSDLIKAIKLKILFSCIKDIFVSAMIASAASVLFVMTAPALILGLVAMVIIIKFISRIIISVISGKVLIGLVALTGIIFIFNIIGLGMVALAYTANIALKGMMGVFIFLISLIPIIGTMIAIGFLLGMVVLASTFALLGTMSMIMMIGGLVAIVIGLKILEKIKIDKDTIVNNIEDITLIIKSIINLLFNNDESDAMISGMNNNTGWLGMISALMDSGGLLIKAVASSIYFISALISITAILIIAGELKLIEQININKAVINNSIQDISNIIFNLNNIIFDSDPNIQSNSQNNSEHKSWIGNLFRGLGSIINIILSSAYLLGAIIAVASILIIAGELKLLERIKIEKDTIKTNISDILISVNYINDILYSDSTYEDKDPDSPEEKKGWLSTIFSNIGRFIGIFLSVPYLLSSLISISLILALGKMLQYISKIEIDRDSIMEKISEIFGTITAIESKLYSGEFTEDNSNNNDEKKSFFETIKNGFLNSISKIWGFIKNTGFLLKAMVTIGLIHLLAEQLKTINDLKSFDNIDVKAASILNAVNTIIIKLNAGEYNGLSNDLEDICDNVVYIDKIIKHFNTIQNNLVKINDIDYTEISQAKLYLVTDSIKNIITKLFYDPSFKIDKGIVKKSEQYSEILSNIIKYNRVMANDINIENHTKLTDNTIRLIDKIDKSKLENLQTAHNMFKEMKEFSESISGNFDGLAEALNEKIAPLLEELKELIGKIPESVDKSASTISTSMYNTTSIANGTANASTMTQQVQSENPTMSKEEVNRMVDQRMNQQAQSVNKGIEMKLEELIDVLQNYSNPIPVRMS